MKAKHNELVTKVKNKTLTQLDVNVLSRQQLEAPVGDEKSLLHLVAYLGTAQMVSWVIEALGPQACAICTTPNSDGWTPLHAVADKGETSALIAMLTVLGSEASAACAIPNKDGWTPLHAVANKGETSALTAMLDILGLEAPAACATPNKDGWTPLHVVADKGKTSALTAMLAALGPEAPAMCIMPNSDGWTPLHAVANKGETSALTAMLDILGSEASAACAMPNSDGWTPLHAVADKGEISALIAMLTVLGSEAPAMCVVPNKDGWTPLHVVADKRDTATLIAMLDILGFEAPAACATPNKDGWTPLHVVADKGDTTALIAMLAALGLEAPTACAMPNKDGWTPLHEVADKREIAALTAMLAALGPEAPIACAMPNKDGWTPLHAVANRQDSTALIAIFNALGPEASAACAMPNSDGWTPLHVAADKGDTDALIVILAALGFAAPAVCAMPNKGGWTPLHFVAHNQSGRLGPAALKAMLAILGPEAGRILALKTNDGFTPLACADKPTGMSALLANPEPYLYTTSTLLEEVKLAQQKLAWMNQRPHQDQLAHVRSDRSQTLLHLVAQKGYIKFVRWLCEQGTQIDSRDEQGNTPMQLAMQSKHYEVVFYLMNKELTQERQQQKATAIELEVKKSELEQEHQQRTEKEKELKATKKALEKTQSKLEMALSALLPVIPSDAVHKEEFPLAKGGYGIVYRGQWLGVTIAIKELINLEFSEAAVAELKEEAHKLARLRSPYIVTIYGITLGTQGQPKGIVMEYMPERSLNRILYNREIALSWLVRRKMALAVAQGLSFLHQQDIIHNDLKSLNVLVRRYSDEWVLKLTDFGLSKIKQETARFTNTPQGTAEWMAPEVFENNDYSKKSDVYAYGVVLWEIVARQRPFRDMGGPLQIMRSVCDRKERPPIPEEAPSLLVGLMGLCWRQSRDKRPAIESVVTKLESLPLKKELRKLDDRGIVVERDNQRAGDNTGFKM